jgi:hypothetical protein
MKKILFTLLILLFCSFHGTAHAAIAFDAVGVQFYTGSGTKTDTSITVGSNANTVLFVINSGSAGDPSAMTWNGVALTKAVAGSSGTRWLSLWYLVAPASGSQTLSITSTNQIYATPISYSGVSQTTPVDQSGYHTGTGSSPSYTTNTLTPANANEWMTSYVQDDAASGLYSVAPMVDRSTEGPFNGARTGDSNGTITQSVANTQQFDIGNTSTYYQFSWTINPYVAAVVVSNPVFQWFGQLIIRGGQLIFW